MKRFIQYALAFVTVALLAATPEAFAQNRAHNTTKSTTTQTTNQNDTKKQSTTTSSDRSKSQGVTTAADRGAKKPSGGTTTKPSSQPSSKPSNPSVTPNKPSGGSSSGNSHVVGSTNDTHRGGAVVKPSEKPGNKPGNKPGESHGYQPGHQPSDRPSGRYDGHYGGRPEPGHTYHERKPMPTPPPSRPGYYYPKPYYHYGDHFYGYFISKPPRGLYSRRYNGIRYYYADGVFYQKVNHYYRVCRPPYGYRIAWSKFGFMPEPVWFSPYAQTYYTDCYYAEGVFYRLSGRYFYVIEPPVGAIIPELPYDYHRVDMYGGTGYQVDNTLYQRVVLDGQIWFEVVANLTPRYY